MVLMVANKFYKIEFSAKKTYRGAAKAKENTLFGVVVRSTKATEIRL
jgi:hypothetical protein